MLFDSVTISSRGQITIPKQVRDILSTKFVRIEVSENNQVTLMPVRDVAGALSDYRSKDKLSYNEVREQTWRNATSNKQNNNEQ